MTAARFDGKILPVRLLVGRWMILSFLVECAYWIACFRLLSADFLVLLFLLFPPILTHPQYWLFNFILRAIPIGMSLALALPCRLIEPTLRSWIWLIAGATFINGFAYMAALLLSLS
jgi:hypothetical protein